MNAAEIGRLAVKAVLALYFVSVAVRAIFTMGERQEPLTPGESLLIVGSAMGLATLVLVAL